MRYDDEFEGLFSRYEPVIGLEVHVELSTKTKMFCSCPIAFGAPPNTLVCPTCLGLPGSLPVANSAAIDATILIGLALNCNIAEDSRFARKNYFYPDMPKNFQISQYDQPLCSDGWLDVDVDGTVVRVEIERVHLEEDTGKLLHIGGATGRISGATQTLVDFNRAGIPLVEIVTKPVAGCGRLAPAVARAYATGLREVILGLNVSDGRMEQGSLRCDVNASLGPRGGAWGTRTETKNVSTLRGIEQAVCFELVRQAGVLDQGGTVRQETRHFHEETGSTTPGRSKENSDDYRYFPEPDLAPVMADPDRIARLRALLPEPARARRERLKAAWAISAAEMDALVNAHAVDLVEATVAAGAGSAPARKWWLGELSRQANARGSQLADLGVTPAQVAEIQQLIDRGELTDSLARQVFDGIIAGEGGPAEVVAARGLAKISDSQLIADAVVAAVVSNPDAVGKIRAGKTAVAGVLVGEVMRMTDGKADPRVVRELVLARTSALPDQVKESS